MVLLTTAFAVLFGIGCLLAVLFEMQGFATPQDQGPRPLYLASLVVGFILCVAAPFAVRKVYDRVAAVIEARSAR